MKLCPHCDQKVPNDETVCPLCEQLIERSCPLCNTVNTHSASRCSNCGYMFPNSDTPPANREASSHFRQPAQRGYQEGTTVKTSAGRSIFWFLVIGVIGGAGYLLFAKGKISIGTPGNSQSKRGSFKRVDNTPPQTPLTPVDPDKIIPKTGITPYAPDTTIPRKTAVKTPRKTYRKTKLDLSKTTSELLKNRLNFLYCARSSNVTQPVHFQFLISRKGRATNVKIQTDPHQASFCFKHELNKMRFRGNRGHWIDVKLPFR